MPYICNWLVGCSSSSLSIESCLLPGSMLSMHKVALFNFISMNHVVKEISNNNNDNNNKNNYYLKLHKKGS